MVSVLSVFSVMHCLSAVPNSANKLDLQFSDSTFMFLLFSSMIIFIWTFIWTIYHFVLNLRQEGLPHLLALQHHLVRSQTSLLHTYLPNELKRLPEQSPSSHNSLSAVITFIAFNAKSLFCLLLVGFQYVQYKYLKNIFTAWTMDGNGMQQKC